jgi:uncharacterized protein involved in exopolysaccharide biosynthesis
MRKTLILLPMLLCASPALAQQPAPQPPPQLTDPAVADRLANAMQAMSKALLDLRVGELKAAVEGGQATPAEKRMTVRDIARRDDPDFDRKFQQRMAQTGPMVRQSMKALNDALPAMMQGLQQAEKALERAAANMPDPTYPKR